MDSYTYVEYLLKNYKILKLQLQDFKETKALEPLENPITEEDMIEELTFKKSYEERVSTSKVSDKVPSIALVYKQVMDKEAKQWSRKMDKAIEATDRELSRLDRAMDHLQPESRRVLRSLYVEGKSYRVVARAMSISESTLSRYRKRGIEYISEFF